METKYIPEILSIRRNVLVEKGKCPAYLEEFEAQEFKNVPVSGIVIKKLDSWGCANIYDPRGFTCSVSNLNELLDKIDIERGVIVQDLCYGKMPRSNSWILYTAEMIKRDSVKLTSVSELKPGWMYRMYGTRGVPVIYLGKLKWKDEYGTPRPHHTFANPETREITPHYYLTASGISSMEVDDPDLYKEVVDVFKSSWFGDRSLKIKEIILNPKIKYGKFDESSLFAPDFERTGWYSGGEILFLKQKDTQTIEVMTVSGQYHKEYTGKYSYCDGRYKEEGKYVKSITIRFYLIKVSENSLPTVKADSQNYNYEYGIERVREILKDSAWGCVDTTDPDTIKNYFGGYRSYYNISAYSPVNFYDCILNNGERIVQSDLRYQRLKF